MTLILTNQVNSNLGLLMAGFALLFVYISVVLGNFNWIEQRVWCFVQKCASHFCIRFSSLLLECL